MQRIGGGGKIVERIARLGPAGGTNMMPGMTEGYRALAKVDAGIKHMIVLTDGQTEGTGYKELSARTAQARDHHLLRGGGRGRRGRADGQHCAGRRRQILPREQSPHDPADLS